MQLISVAVTGRINIKTFLKSCQCTTRISRYEKNLCVSHYKVSEQTYAAVQIVEYFTLYLEGSPFVNFLHLATKKITGPRQVNSILMSKILSNHSVAKRFPQSTSSIIPTLLQMSDFKLNRALNHFISPLWIQKLG